MKRLTTEKPVQDMSSSELAHNCLFVKNREVWYRDYDREIPLRDLIREIAMAHGVSLPSDNEEFDVEMYDCLQYDPAECKEGLLALLNMVAWAFAENREKLKMYEDKE